MKTKTVHNQVLTSVGVLMFVGVFAGLTGCDTTSVTTDGGSAADVSVPASALIDDLDMSNDQAAEFADLLERYGEDQPGRFWYVAAELQQSLTAAQKDELIANSQARIQEGREEKMNRRRGRRGDGPGDSFTSSLTEEQRELVNAIREGHRETMKALLEQKRAGTLSDEEFQTRVEALREEMKTALGEILTDEQQAEFESLRESRPGAGQRGIRREEGDGAGPMNRGARRDASRDRLEEGRAAMFDALDVTEAQQEQLRQLRERQREALEALREEARSSESNREQIREQLKGLRSTLLEERADIFTEAQQETIQIHRALSVLFRPDLRQNRAGGSRKGMRRFNRG